MDGIRLQSALAPPAACRGQRIVPAGRRVWVVTSACRGRLLQRLPQRHSRAPPSCRFSAAIDSLLPGAGGRTRRPASVHPLLRRHQPASLPARIVMGSASSAVAHGPHVARAAAPNSIEPGIRRVGGGVGPSRAIPVQDGPLRRRAKRHPSGATTRETATSKGATATGEAASTWPLEPRNVRTAAGGMVEAPVTATPLPPEAAPGRAPRGVHSRW
jgi:hypothetical protein